MLPSALFIAVGMPIGGRLVDRIGARLPVSAGVAILALSFVGLVSVTIDTPLWAIAGLLAVGGLGSGLAMMSPNIIAMNSVTAPEVSQASGLSNVTRQVSAAIGVAVLASIFATVRQDGAPDPGRCRRRAGRTARRRTDLNAPASRAALTRRGPTRRRAGAPGLLRRDAA
jgi:DHA2 family multidrug resistance protein